MSISYLRVPNFDHLFNAVKHPVIVNEVPYITAEDRANFNDLLLFTYNTDTLSNIPSCKCGDMVVGKHMEKQINEQAIICPNCNTRILSKDDNDNELRVWLRVPEGINGFVIPVVWVQLTELLNSKGYNLLEWLTNSRSIPPDKITKDTKRRIIYLTSIGWPRGLNNFIANFDAFLDILPILAKSKKDKLIPYGDYLRTIRDRIFPKYLPLPIKTMLILENTPLGSFADKVAMTGAIDAARTIAYISTPRLKPLTINQVETKTVSVITNLVAYHRATIRNNLCSKKGWLRGQLFCSRSHFCLRGVITSLSIPHYREELHIPWAQGLEILKYHIVSVFEKRGWDPTVAYNYVEASGNVFEPRIHDVINELIRNGTKIKKNLVTTCDEHGNLIQQADFDVPNLPDAGVIAILQRNPSLDKLSGQTVFITKVKDDLRDKTISLSVLTTRGFNADFDGDDHLLA